MTAFILATNGLFDSLWMVAFIARNYFFFRYAFHTYSTYFLVFKSMAIFKYTLGNLLTNIYISLMITILSKRHVISFTYSIFIRCLFSETTPLDTFEISFFHQSEEIKHHPNNPVPNFDEEEKIDYTSLKYEAPVVTLWCGIFYYICVVSVYFYFTGPAEDNQP